MSAANAYFKWVPPIFSFDLLIQMVVGFLAISVTVYYFEKIRSSYEIKLDHLVKEREVLLKELHHRVKNNMQVIMSMLWLQVDKIEDPKYAQMFLENIDRLSAMAQVHENLYKADKLEAIEIKAYLRDLLEGLKRVSPYAIEYSLDPISLDMKSAVNIGLIVNEAVTNAIQHANMTGDGVIRVTLKKQKNDWLQIIISDTGVNTQVIEEIEDSLGLALIKDMVRSLYGGRLRLKSNGGFSLIIDFRQEVR
jgi:two-component sensor histidine kinase